MSEQIDLKALQRDAHHTYNSDGILDISVGISLTICAILIYSGISWLSFAAVAAGVSTYYALKKIVTMPRTGYVKFKLFDEGFAGKSMITAAAISVAAFAVIVLTAIITKDTLLTLAVIAASMLVLAGYTFYIRRLYVYAAVIVTVCVAGRAFGLENALMASIPQDVVHVLYILVPGMLMLLAGILLMAMYMGKYRPLASGEPVMER